jgi:hypothetical protein
MCLLLAVGVWERNHVWRTERSLWEDAYKKAPRRARTTSALAWVLATDEDDPDPVRALELAKRSFDSRYADPWRGVDFFMVDTLAEAYYVNGMYAQAVAVESSIFKIKKKPSHHFRRQLEKFLAAAKTQPVRQRIKRETARPLGDQADKEK